MKKLVLMVTALCMTGIMVNAQTEKGNVIVGAQLANIGANIREGSSSFNLSLSPRAGWFIKDDWAVGAEVNLNMTFQEGDDPIGWGIVPFARYYFPGEGFEVVKKTRIFAEAGAGVGGEGTGGETTTGFRGFAGAGVAYFVSENIALETGARLGLIAGSGATTLNPNINLGFQIHLPTKKLQEMRGDVQK
ncbi:hypothetical protein GCM10027051_25790 [Niabella terrae]